MVLCSKAVLQKVMYMILITLKEWWHLLQVNNYWVTGLIDQTLYR